MFVRRLMDDLFPFRFLETDDKGGGGTDTKPADDPNRPDPSKPADKPADQDNEANKWRRLAEKAQKEAQDLKDADQKRQDAELSETERLKKEAADAKKEAADAKLDALRAKHGKNLPEEALEFLTGTDETTLAAQAEKLAKVYKPAPAQAGTVTQPAANQQPTIDEQIAAAEKAGNTLQAIRLKRQKAFGGD